MPKLNFDQVEEVQDFSPLPDGKYLCQLNDIEESSTQYNDEMWKVRFEVIDGEDAGRMIFDNLVFSKAALKRVKLICSRLGLDVSGEVDLTPELLKGRKCYVSATTEEYQEEEGRTKKRNVVPFAGYERISEATGAAESSDDESEENLPF